ncbi:MAG TPA: DUF72 domain-containing protein [Vicinamibacterales bacterium]|nr:DUF72 domain-containing protein [Vicinamibacterales bacterium]
MPRPHARIGCSGWNYKTWRATFYPTDLSIERWLEFYASCFDTVEINSTFYRLPERSTFAKWQAQTPGEFLFAVKASRFLTHMKRLRAPREPLARLFSRASALGRQLGPTLYQLPGNFTIDLARLEAFLGALPRLSSGGRLRHVMEFRHPSWYVDETYQLLKRRGVALCLHDKAGSEVAEPIDGPFVYVRFHGTSGLYHGSYGRLALTRWAHRLVEQQQDGRQVFAYFNNDPDAAAVGNARTLRSILQKLS